MAANLIGQMFPNKRLNEVIFPGAHDAGTSAATLGGNVRTQSVDVAAQAEFGCRYFDVRVAFKKIGRGNAAKTVATTFHAFSVKTKTSSVGLTHNKLTLGDWGDSLDTILTQAKKFVTANPTEFIILRFSKSKDYPEIIDSCMRILGDSLYREHGNLGEQTLAAMSGKVITVYSDTDDDNVGRRIDGGAYRTSQHGVIRIKELYSKSGTPKTYDPTFDGFQYFGKYSDTNSAATNAKTQKARMVAPVHRDAVGMMYWTLTGITPSGIIGRNDSLWQNAPLRDTWNSGLKDAIALRLGQMRNLEILEAINSQSYKSFMPNIIMIDDVNANRCDTIFALNAITSTQLAKQFREEVIRRGFNLTSARRNYFPNQ